MGALTYAAPDWIRPRHKPASGGSAARETFVLAADYEAQCVFAVSLVAKGSHRDGRAKTSSACQPASSLGEGSNVQIPGAKAAREMATVKIQGHHCRPQDMERWMSFVIRGPRRRIRLSVEMPSQSHDPGGAMGGSAVANINPETPTKSPCMLCIE